jgi:type II secretion system protein C
MARYVSWLANAALLMLCCVLIASTTNAVFAAWLTPEPVVAAAEGAGAPALAERGWNDRQVILARNLFNASLLAPPRTTAIAVEEDLEETKLPLTLLGTFASPNPEIARAAVEDKTARTHLVLRVGDEIQDGRAKLIRIERRRIVLSENGTLRELTFTDSLSDDKPRISSASSRRSGRRAVASRRRSRRRAEPSTRSAEAPQEVEQALRSPADIFSEARILPKWENGQMVGVQVSGIKPGSLFEEIGIADGEVITELNGIAIDSPEASAQVMLELTESNIFDVRVEGDDGPRNVNVTVER